MGFISIVKREYKFLNNYYIERKFRKVIQPVVSGLITSEDSSIHWKWLDVKDRIVLDLGCGLWEVTDLREASPVYFKNRGAKKIIGVDPNEKDISTLKNYFDEHFPGDGSEFVVKSIANANDLTELIAKYQIETLKCDIEGFEKVMFSIDKSQIENIVNISVEYHDRQLFLGMLKTLNNWGFKIINHSLFSYASQNMGVLTAQRS